MSLLAHLLRRAGREDGAVIVIVAVFLTCALGAGALAIDLGSARASEQKAQAAADAASLAVSDAYSSGTTSAAALQTVAQNMVDANDPGATAGTPEQVSSGVWKVPVSGTSAGTFGGHFGRGPIPVSAAAIAAVSTTVTTTTGIGTSTHTNTITNTSTSTVTNTSTGTVTSLTCPSAGNGCLALFASGTSCGADSSSSSDPIVFGGGVHVTGGSWSDGSINLGGGGSSWGPLTYKSGCSISPDNGSSPPAYKQNSSTFNGGYPVGAAPLAPWPVDYSADFPTCSGSRCSGPLKTPSFCTQASTAGSWSIDTYNSPYTLKTNQIYCAIGSGTASKPSTWNGALTISGGGTSNNVPNIHSTFVAGSISIGGGTALEACGFTTSGYDTSRCDTGPSPVTDNYPLFYATKGNVDDSNGGTALTGDWFAPAGAIKVGGGTAFVGFLEGVTVNMSAGGITGDGPPSSGGTIGSTSTTTSTSTSLSTSTSTTTSLSTSTSATTGSQTLTTGSKLTG